MKFGEQIEFRGKRYVLTRANRDYCCTKCDVGLDCLDDEFDRLDVDCVTDDHYHGFFERVGGE